MALQDLLGKQTVILFVGRRPQDQPNQDVLKWMDSATVLRTDERGMITYVIDSEKVKFQAAK